MPSPALSYIWLLWRRHRFGLSALSVYLLGLTLLLYRLSSADAYRSGGAMATFVIFGLLYLISLFTYPEGDLVSGQSGFPSYLLTLPVRTRELITWPMFIGTLCIALVWIGLARWVLIPCGVPVAVGWPAAMLAAILALVQVLMWYPWKIPYLRIGLALLLVPGVLMMGFFRQDLGLSDPAVIVVFLGLCVVAYETAVAGLTRVRHGEESSLFRFAEPKRFPGDASPRRPPFRSPAHAQLWAEWRQTGLFLPVCTACACLLFTLVVLMVRDTVPLGVGGIQVNVALKMLLLPLLLFPIFCGGIRKPQAHRQDSRLPVFLTTRPMTAIDLILAKLRAAAISALIAWAILLLFGATWLLLPTHDHRRDGPLGLLLLHYATPRSAMTLLFALAMLIAWTWKNQVQGLFASLSGRPWLIHSYSLMTVGLIPAILIYLVARIAGEPELLPIFLRSLPLLAATAILLKALVSGLAVWLLARRRLLSPGILAKLATVWLLIALSLFTLLSWLLPPGTVSSHQLAAGIVLFLPLARLALAPLALEWNRHD